MKTIVQNGMEQRQKLVHPCSLRIRIKDLVSPTQSGKFSLLQFNDRWQWGARAETELVPVIEKARVTRYNFWYKDLLPSRACVPSLSALIPRLHLIPDCIAANETARTAFQRFSAKSWASALLYDGRFHAARPLSALAQQNRISSYFSAGSLFRYITKSSRRRSW